MNGIIAYECKQIESPPFPNRVPIEPPTEFRVVESIAVR